jgi:hypothetical protein
MHSSDGRAPVTDRLGLSYDYCLTDPHAALFAELAVALELPHVRELRWNSTIDSLENLVGHALRSAQFRWGYSVVLDLTDEAGCHAYAWLHDGVFRAHVAGATVAGIERAKRFLHERVPVSTPTAEQKVPVTFWAYGRHGPDATARSIAVSTWDDVRGNYPEAVGSQLERLMAESFRPAAAGQLLLWHGEPGTGKTYALRALAWQWREWCSLHYVTDPETFFGSRADYLLDVLMDDDNEEDGRWQLLVLEDTGELLGADAKSRTGQGLSRLLNVVDGIIGQGLRVLVLVTTNDDLRVLHPAVSRPGRCLACVEFVPFDEAEAAAWLERNGVDGDPRTATLAGLFSKADGEELPARQPVGFVR